MTYRDILVQIDETASSAARTATAVDLARRWNAQLTGVFLKSEFLHSYLVVEGIAYLPAVTIDTLLEEHAAATLKASEAAREAFEAAAAKAGVVSDWRVIDGDVDAPLIACARRFDLTIFPTVARASLGDHQISAGVLGMAAGGPILVTPSDDYRVSVGRRVVVAWNGSRESARALRDAQPFLKAADEIHVVVVSPDGEGGPDGLLQRHLEHHGHKANLIVDRGSDASAASILRTQVTALGADMLVLGLYGRSRLEELVLSGVSRDMLRNPPVPLLISH